MTNFIVFDGSWKILLYEAGTFYCRFPFERIFSCKSSKSYSTHCMTEKGSKHKQIQLDLWAKTTSFYCLRHNSQFDKFIFGIFAKQKSFPPVSSSNHRESSSRRIGFTRKKFKISITFNHIFNSWVKAEQENFVIPFWGFLYADEVSRVEGGDEWWKVSYQDWKPAINSSNPFPDSRGITQRV